MKHKKLFVLLGIQHRQIDLNTLLGLFFPRMQRLAQEQNEEIEKVNHEKNYHQQTTAYELNALSQEWRQLCVKNMEIQSVCAVLETKIDSLKKEAFERRMKFCYCLFALQAQN
ncbi:unnamed protein product [Eruca vesicaria subsp. sativa]|uniref:Uncharacterized protein n=1 Tax=Eruca vesicaria subsp. sativa TaxID=29727 RepID=A0ABC8KT94_ERUVS|nr:unnamed protein product [Eruca vesicaria subsp. sativa]